MTEKKQPSIAEILAACRKADGSGGEAASPVGDTAAQTEPQSQVADAAAEPASSAPVAARTSKPAGKMSVADMIAAAKAERTGGASAKQPAAAPATTAKKPGQMSVAEMMATARAEKSAPAAKVAPAAKAAAAPASAKPAADKASPKAPAAAKPAVAAMDTASILAAARKSTQPGPMTKAEAAKLQKAAPKKAASPTMPEKPAYLAARPAKSADTDSTDRRGFFAVLFGSFLAVGFSCLALVNVIWGLGLARFMFPNILTEAPSKFKVGFPSDFPQGTVATKFIAQYGVWIVNTEYEGQMQIVALKTVCTHLGCTPNWLDGEQKFKCPCHGSGFYIDGINFEGPAPRPLERYAIRLADDGQLEVDKSKKFQQEMGQWSSPMCYVPV